VVVVARRYQQGIGIPERLGAPLGEWKDPTPTPTGSFDLKVPNTGAQRNYGSTPGYVDTVPHRWKVGEQTNFKGAGAGLQKWQEQGQAAQSLGISRGELRRNSRTSARASRVEGMTRPYTESAERASRARDIEMEETEAASRAGTTVEALRSSRESAARERRITGMAEGYRAEVARSAGTPMPPSSVEDFDTVADRESRWSPPTGRGRPVPTPPPSGSATDAPAGTPPLDMPPMPPRRATEAPWMTREPEEPALGDPFMEGLRRAPLIGEDTPLDSPVAWRDDPDMPALGLPGDAGDKALESWLRGGGAGSAITPPASSRTQKRPKTT
jgi:hypothetical protein